MGFRLRTRVNADTKGQNVALSAVNSLSADGLDFRLLRADPDARRPVVRLDFTKDRSGLCTLRNGIRAPCPEPASRRWFERRGHIARQDHPLSSSRGANHR